MLKKMFDIFFSKKIHFFKTFIFLKKKMLKIVCSIFFLRFSNKFSINFYSNIFSAKKKSFIYFFFRLKMFWKVCSINVMVGSFWGGVCRSLTRNNPIFVTPSPQFWMITRKIEIGEFFHYFSHIIQHTPHHP